MTQAEQQTDDTTLQQAQERLEKRRAARPVEPAPETLAGAIATAERALSGRWLDAGGHQDSAAAARALRAERQAALERVREQVPQHCRGTRAELVVRMADKLFRAVDSWLWGSENLLLLGSTGAGKTTAAAYLLRRLCALAADQGGEALELAKLIRWQECRELTVAMREHPLGEGAPETVTRCQNARLLILDDLGAGDDKAPLERILNERYKRGWPTITTSGLQYRELVSALGEHLVRRLVETHGKKGRVLQAFAKTPEKTT